MTEPNLFNPEGEDEPRHEGEVRRLSAHDIVEIKQMCNLTLSALVRLEKTMGKLLDLANGINTTATDIATAVGPAVDAAAENAAATTVLEGVQSTLQGVLASLTPAAGTASAGAAPAAPAGAAPLPAGAVGTDASGNPVDAQGNVVPAAPTA